MMIFKQQEIFEDGELRGEIFSKMQHGDWTLQAAMQTDQIGFFKTEYEDVLVFDKDTITELTTAINVWQQRRMQYAGYYPILAHVKGLVGYAYMPPWSTVETRLNRSEVDDEETVKTKKEKIAGLQKIKEIFFNDEFAKERFLLDGGILCTMTRSYIRLEQGENTLRLHEDDRHTITECIQTWKKRWP